MKMTFITNKARASLFAIAAAFGVTLGCGSDDAKNGMSAPEGSVYLAMTRVFTPGGEVTTSYLHVLPSLEERTAVDSAKALEIPGSAKLYAIEGVGWFAVGDGESPTITRYTLGEDGALAATQSIGLHNYGVTSLWPTLYVVSPTKMVYPDRDGGQLLVINPTEMTITNRIPLPQTHREGYLALYGYGAVPRDGRLLISVGWFDWTADRILPETGLVVLDTNTDTVARFDVDTRCAGITQPAPMTSGDTYFAMSALAGAAHQRGRLSTAPCALRIRAGADAFDPDYAFPLGDLAGGAIVGEPVPVGGDSMFLRVLDPALSHSSPTGASFELTAEPAWRWLRWNVATGAATPIDALQPSTADVVWFEVDGRVFGAETTKDYAQTRLLELSAAGGPKPALTAPGFVSGLARIR